MDSGKIGGLVLFVLGIMGLLFGSIFFVIAVGPQDDDSAISTTGWTICGTIIVIVSVLFLVLGWWLLMRSSLTAPADASPFRRSSGPGFDPPYQKPDVPSAQAKDGPTPSRMVSAEEIEGPSDGLSREEKLKRYEDILRVIIEDGRIDKDEAEILAIMQRTDDITMDDFKRTLDRLQEEKRSQ